MMIAHTFQSHWTCSLHMRFWLSIEQLMRPQDMTTLHIDTYSNVHTVVSWSDIGMQHCADGHTKVGLFGCYLQCTVWRWNYWTYYLCTLCQVRAISKLMQTYGCKVVEVFIILPNKKKGYELLLVRWAPVQSSINRWVYEKTSRGLYIQHYRGKTQRVEQKLRLKSVASWAVRTSW